MNALNAKEGGVCQKKWNEIERSRTPATRSSSAASLRLIYVKWKVYQSRGWVCGALLRGTERRKGASVLAAHTVRRWEKGFRLAMGIPAL